MADAGQPESRRLASRRGPWRLVQALLVILSPLLILGAMLMALPIVAGKSGPLGAKNVTTGQPLAWREIKLPTPVQWAMGTVACDIDGDGDDELTFLDRNMGTIQLIELDGASAGQVSISTTTSKSAIWTFDLGGAFDYDGDGAEELVLQDTNGISFWNTTGLVATRKGSGFFGRTSNRFALSGDADGDGVNELWLQDLSPGVPPIRIAMATGGQVVMSQPTSGGTYQVIVCDLDKDGRAELVEQDYGGGLHRTDVGGAMTNIGQLGTTNLTLTTCVDCSGDGQPDLVFGKVGFFDRAASQFVNFNLGHSNNPYDFEAQHAFDPDGDGQMELIDLKWTYTGPWGMSSYSTLEAIDPLRHKIEYSERMPTATSIILASSRGQEHLVVVDHNKLLIYP